MLLISFVINCIFISVISLIFGIFVYLAGRTKRLNQVWGLMSLSIAFWSLGLGLMSYAPNKALAYFYLKAFHYLGAIFIPSLYLHFTLILLEIEQTKRKIIISSYIISFGFQIANFLGLLAYAEPLSPFKYYTRPKFFYIPFTVFFTVCALYVICSLFVGLKKTSGIKRNQIKYQLIATLLGFGGGSTAFLPVFDIPIFPWGMYCMFLYIVIMTYAIIKHRLMDVNLIIRDTTVHVISSSYNMF